jgi:outer membrane protein W
MKKITFLLAITTLIFSSNKGFAQAAQQGNIVVNPFYGSPSIGTLLLKSIFAEGGSEADFSYVGPVGLNFEYFISDNISVGLEGSYTNISLESNVDGIQDKLLLQTTRIYPKFNFHFKTSDKVDPYFSLGGGFKRSNIKYTTNDPNSENDQESFTPLIPFSFRTALGLRYYVNDHIGFSGEFGFGGGSLFAGGLVFKL